MSFGVKQTKSQKMESLKNIKIFGHLGGSALLLPFPSKTSEKLSHCDIPKQQPLVLEDILFRNVQNGYCASSQRFSIGTGLRKFCSVYADTPFLIPVLLLIFGVFEVLLLFISKTMQSTGPNPQI